MLGSGGKRRSCTLERKRFSECTLPHTHDSRVTCQSLILRHPPVKCAHPSFSHGIHSHPHLLNQTVRSAHHSKRSLTKPPPQQQQPHDKNAILLTSVYRLSRPFLNVSLLLLRPGLHTSSPMGLTSRLTGIITHFLVIVPLQAGRTVLIVGNSGRVVFVFGTALDESIALVGVGIETVFGSETVGPYDVFWRAGEGGGRGGVLDVGYSRMSYG